MSPMRDGTGQTTSEDRATQLLIWETLSLAIKYDSPTLISVVSLLPTITLVMASGTFEKLNRKLACKHFWFGANLNWNFGQEWRRQHSNIKIVSWTTMQLCFSCSCSFSSQSSKLLYQPNNRTHLKKPRLKRGWGGEEERRLPNFCSSFNLFS